MFNKIKNSFRKGEPCKYECQNGKGFCGAQAPVGFYSCTRNAEHKGQHVACGSYEHNFLSWR